MPPLISPHIDSRTGPTGGRAQVSSSGEAAMQAADGQASLIGDERQESVDDVAESLERDSATDVVWEAGQFGFSVIFIDLEAWEAWMFELPCLTFRGSARTEVLRLGMLARVDFY